MYSCPQCGLITPMPSVAPVHCSCGFVDTTPRPARIDRQQLAGRIEECQSCEHFQTGKGCMKMAKPCRVERYWAGYARCPKRSNMQFQRGRVGFLAACYQPIGGTEVWHQTLLPRLNGVSGFVSLNEKISSGDFTKIVCAWGTGWQSACNLANSCDVLVAWGIGPDLASIVNGKHCKVISVSHCDSRSDWTRQFMQDQASVSDAAVYICPSGRRTCPAGVPAYYIPNAPDPERVRSRLTRDEARAKLGIHATQKLIVSIGRISSEKRTDTIGEAAELLPPSYTTVIAGSSNGFSAYYGAHIDRPESARVRWIGDVETPADLLAAADLYVSISDYEGYGLATAEAILAGVPVVSTRVGLLETCPDFATLIDFEPTPQQLAATIVHACGSREAKQKARPARQGIDRVDDFVTGWQRLIDQIAGPKE